MFGWAFFTLPLSSTVFMSRLCQYIRHEFMRNMNTVPHTKTRVGLVVLCRSYRFSLDVTIQKQANATGGAEVVDRNGVGARLGERFAVNDVDRAGRVWGGVVERWRH